MLGYDFPRDNAEVCLWSTWYNIPLVEYFYAHTSGVQNMRFNGTLVHGVIAVKVDAGLRPNATTLFRESDLGTREQMEFIIDAAFPLLACTNPGFAFVPNLPATKAACVALPHGL